ncbi:tetratricopeptide repeat protein [Streptacidiphilus sp. 4-A2]|nr:tetratricopeptide repeat protein [Streptacidiphilus sp. 4-A2]
MAGDYSTATRLHEQALALYQQLGDRLGEANTFYSLGRARRQDGDLAGSAELAERALAVYQELGDGLGEANSLWDLGRVRSAMGQDTDAAGAGAAVPGAPTRGWAIRWARPTPSAISAACASGSGTTRRRPACWSSRSRSTSASGNCTVRPWASTIWRSWPTRRGATAPPSGCSRRPWRSTGGDPRSCARPWPTGTWPRVARRGRPVGGGGRLQAGRGPLRRLGRPQRAAETTAELDDLPTTRRRCRP